MIGGDTQSVTPNLTPESFQLFPFYTQPHLLLCHHLQDRAQQSERMLAEMAAQMQQLRVENEELQGRNIQLEGLLKVQQQQQHDSSGSRRLHATQVG